MKRTFVSVLLLAIMAISGSVLYAHTDRVTGEIAGRLEELEKDPDAGSAKAILEDWEDFCSNNIFLTNNECAFEISQMLVRITSELAAGKDAAEECRSARMLISVYRRSCAPIPENVF